MFSVIILIIKNLMMIISDIKLGMITELEKFVAISDFKMFNARQEGKISCLAKNKNQFFSHEIAPRLRRMWD